jgi:hypothetical protein
MPESRADHGHSDDAMSVCKEPAPVPGSNEPEGEDGEHAPAEVTPQPE